MKHNKMRKFTYILSFIPMTLSLLAQTTPLWAKNQNGSPIFICSALGTEKIFINENGQKLPNQPTHDTKHCVMCLASAGDKITPTTPNTINTTFKTTKIRFHTFENTQIKTNTAQTSNAIRAPPQHS